MADFEDGEYIDERIIIQRPRAFGGTLNASGYSGKYGSDKIQKALDEAKGDRSVVVVSGNGPDDVSDHANATRSNAWLIDRPLEVPSDTILLFEGAHLFLDDATNENIVRNTKAGDGTNDRNENIHVWGDNATFLNGNGKNQNRPLTSETQEEPDPMAHFGVFLHKIDRATVGGFQLGRTGGWAAAVQNFENVRFHNITLRQPGDVHNEDGISFIGPGTHGQAAGIVGTTSDDVGTIYTAPTWLQNDLGGYGDVERVSFSNFAATDTAPYGPGFRFQAETTSGGTDTKIVGATIDGARTTAGGFQLRNVNGTQSHSQIRGIHVSNAVFENARSGFLFEGQSENVTISDVTYTTANETVVYPQAKDASTVDASIHGLTVTNVYAESDDPFFSVGDNTGDMERVTIRDCYHHTPNGGNDNAVIEAFGAAQTLRDCTIEGFRCDGTRTNAEFFWSGANWTLDNVSIRNVTAKDIGSNVISVNGSVTRPFVVDHITMQNVTGSKFGTRPAETLENFTGTESANAETPTAANWPAGAVVDFTDSGDGSGTGVYKLLHDGTWSQIGS